MAAFLKLRQYESKSFEKYFELTRSAHLMHDTEFNAAVIIQRNWRGYIARQYVTYLNSQALNIQRIWRGYKGRKRANHLKKQYLKRIEEAYFDSVATIIQRVWRGVLSRRLLKIPRRHYENRKKMLDVVHKQGVLLSEEVIRYNHKLIEYNLMKKQDDDAAEFEKVAESLHHLTSTFSIPGVYSSPFGDVYKATAWGIPMDTHLREAFDNRLCRVRAERLQLNASKRLHLRQTKKLEKEQDAIVWEPVTNVKDVGVMISQLHDEIENELMPQFQKAQDMKDLVNKNDIMVLDSMRVPSNAALLLAECFCRLVNLAPAAPLSFDKSGAAEQSTTETGLAGEHAVIERTSPDYWTVAKKYIFSPVHKFLRFLAGFDSYKCSNSMMNHISMLLGNPMLDPNNQSSNISSLCIWLRGTVLKHKTGKRFIALTRRIEELRGIQGSAGNSREGGKRPQNSRGGGGSVQFSGFNISREGGNRKALQSRGQSRGKSAQNSRGMAGMGALFDEPTAGVPRPPQQTVLYSSEDVQPLSQQATQVNSMQMSGGGAYFNKTGKQQKERGNLERKSKAILQQQGGSL